MKAAAAVGSTVANAPDLDAVRDDRPEAPLVRIAALRHASATDQPRATAIRGRRPSRARGRRSRPRRGHGSGPRAGRSAWCRRCPRSSSPSTASSAAVFEAGGHALHDRRAGHPASTPRGRTGWLPGCPSLGRCRGRWCRRSPVHGTASWQRPRSRGDGRSRPRAAPPNERLLGAQPRVLTRIASSAHGRARRVPGPSAATAPVIPARSGRSVCVGLIRSRAFAAATPTHSGRHEGWIRSSRPASGRSKTSRSGSPTHRRRCSHGSVAAVGDT